MSVHSCPECGLEHGAAEHKGEDPEVKAAKILADRDVEIARINAGVSREEMLREIEALRAELTVRREEPPVAETAVIQVTETEEEPEVVEVPAPEPEPEPEPEETPPPPETAGDHEPGRKKKAGWWDNYA